MQCLLPSDRSNEQESITEISPGNKGATMTDVSIRYTWLVLLIRNGLKSQFLDLECQFWHARVLNKKNYTVKRDNSIHVFTPVFSLIHVIQRYYVTWLWYNWSLKCTALVTLAYCPRTHAVAMGNAFLQGDIDIAEQVLIISGSRGCCGYAMFAFSCGKVGSNRRVSARKRNSSALVVHEWCNPSALAITLRLACTDPSILDFHRDCGYRRVIDNSVPCIIMRTSEKLNIRCFGQAVPCTELQSVEV